MGPQLFWQAGWYPRNGWALCCWRPWLGALVVGPGRAHLPVTYHAGGHWGGCTRLGATWWSGAVLGWRACWCPLMLLLHWAQLGGWAVPCCCGRARGERVPLREAGCRTALSQLPPPVVLAPTAGCVRPGMGRCARALLVPL